MHLLVIVVEQNKQICQLRADLFGKVPESKFLPPEHPIIKQCIDFYQPLICKYIADEIKDNHEFQHERDKKIFQLGLVCKPKGHVEKKPAKAAEEPSHLHDFEAAAAAASSSSKHRRMEAAAAPSHGISS